MPITRKARTRVPHRVPPPLTRGDERIDGEVILNELDGDLALLVWKCFRAGSLWAATAVAERPRLYGRGARGSREAFFEALAGGEEPPFEALRAIGTLTMQGRGVGSASVLATHCRTVEAWAEAEGAIGTALLFAQLASQLLPASGFLANNVARRARTAGQYARAESWFRHAIAVARRESDWDSYVGAYLGLGVTYRLRGSYPLARKSLNRALRRARRQARNELQGMACHELMIVATSTDNLRQIDRYAREALESYGDSHPRLPALAHDVGIFFMNRGYFDLASRVFLAIPATYGDPYDQLARLSSIVRATGALGQRREFDEAWAAAESLIREPTAIARGTGPLCEMARGAVSIGDLDLARGIASRAVELALARAEAEYRMEAEAVLQEIESKRSLLRAEVVPAPRPVSDLAADVVARVAAG